MIHFRKRLNIFEIIKAFLLSKKLNLSHWKKSNDQKSILLSKSSWAILLIAIWIRFKKKGENPIFLVPDYYCDYSLNLLRVLGSKIIFYNIEENFEPSFNSINSIENFDALIVTHYFGKSKDFSKFSDYCISKKKLLIEDATHCLKKTDNIGNYGHFTLYSQHKFFSCINGALLVLNEKKLSKEDLEFFVDKSNCINLLNKFIIDKKVYVYNNNFRILINIIYDCFIKIFKKEKIESFKSDGLKKVKYSHPKIDYISMKILSFNSNKIGFLSDYRKKCHLIIETYLEKILIQDDYEVLTSAKFDPYLLVIKSSNNAEKIFNILKENGLAVQTWPDIPEEINKDSFAFFLRNNLIFIPLNKICLKKFSISTYENNFFLKLSECKEKEKWEQIIKKFDVNILQTWEYGNFKGKLPFAKSRRYLINDSKNSIIGLFQSINYRFFGLTFVFINRGPILIKKLDTITQKEITEKVVKFIKKNFLTFILIKPELKFSKENIIFNQNGKLSYFKYPSWCSSIINLSEDEINIFKKFKSSLKSEISKSEKNLKIDSYNQIKNLNWISQRYFSFENKKKFKTINESLINYLNSDKIISFCAKKDENICSGVVIYCHGKSATYLMSYNTDLGRKNYGNQLLLWESIKYLKNKNYNYLDLGGIDYDNNLNVAKFKLAFNGKLYKLIGANLI